MRRDIAGVDFAVPASATAPSVLRGFATAQLIAQAASLCDISVGVNGTSVSAARLIQAEKRGHVVLGGRQATRVAVKPMTAGPRVYKGSVRGIPPRGRPIKG